MLAAALIVAGHGAMYNISVSIKSLDTISDCASMAFRLFSAHFRDEEGKPTFEDARTSDILYPISKNQWGVLVGYVQIRVCRIVRYHAGL